MTRDGMATASHRLLSLVTRVDRHELNGTLKLTVRIFLVMLAYYLLKPTREALVLSDGGAELRSYAVGAQAALLLLILPVYAYFSHRHVGERLFIGVTLFFVSNLFVFYLLGVNGASLGLAFFIWLGVFNVTQIAQFWALAAHLHTVESGQRLFALIALGGSGGALAGSQVAEGLFAVLGPYQIMLVAAAVLLFSIIAGIGVGRGSVAHNRKAEPPAGYRAFFGGVGTVLADPYLRLIALFVVLLNCINSTGEFILADLVVSHVDSTLAEGGGRGGRIGAFYADFFFWVNLLSLLFQLFLVSRLYRFVGVRGALLVLPLIAVSGYALMAFIPIFAIVRAVKILENSTDYSIQTTTRHVLFLPVTLEGKYEGKTTIETLFWRLGDLLQAGLVFIGTTFIGFSVQQFAFLNLGLAVVWVIVASRIGHLYRCLACPAEAETVSPPEMADPAVQATAEEGAAGTGWKSRRLGTAMDEV